MQDPLQLDDPRLELLAQQLAATTLRLAARDRDNLLYTTGFAAGQQAAARSVRRWRATAASTAFLAVGICVFSPIYQNSSPVAVETVSIAENATEQLPFLVPREETMRSQVLRAGASWDRAHAILEESWNPTQVVSSSFLAPSPRPKLSVGAGRANYEFWE